VLTDATADLTMALLLASARRIVEAAAYIHQGKWQTWEPMGLLGCDLREAILGIVGLGRIGKAVAKRCSGFDMRLLAYSPSATETDTAGLNVRLVDLDTLLSESDFVSLHIPLNEQTRHFMNAQTLAKMKPSAILINTARGGVVDQAALCDALKNGVIAGAALDVCTPEPIPLDDPLLTLPNVTLLPHIGSASRKTRDLMASMAADNLLAGVFGEPLPNCVV
jgi:glyoxylate reductase